MSAASAIHGTFVHNVTDHRPKQAPLRLTRRGRFVFFGVPLILLAALLLSLSGFLNAPAKAADSAGQLC